MYTPWSVVYGEQPSAAKWNILGSNDAHFYGFLGDNQEWSSWTPTLSGRLNDSKWTKNCKYKQVGKTVICKLTLKANAATPMDGGSGDATFTLPVTSVALASAIGNSIPIGTGQLIDANGSYYPATVFQSSTTVAGLFVLNAGGTYASLTGINSTIPFTWVSTDEIHATFTYEAA